ncbi:unnamed protein product [Phytophthora lilii]|uniref:Unnamed protein product n=1 Tax=Phytophthora lilii TaxID=2077276 RepID=A0A9W6X6G1_9STRA|nr:unnamed protein product [Phytophthora lilii]
MCNFIRSNGEQCKLARNKERCGKHPIIMDKEAIVVESNIVEEMPPQVNTPVVAEVVDTPEPSVIEPVEASNVEVSKVPELDESNVEPVATDSATKLNSPQCGLVPTQAVEMVPITDSADNHSNLPKVHDDSWIYESSDDDSSDEDSIVWDESNEPAPVATPAAKPLGRTKDRRERIFRGDFTPSGSDKTLEIEIFKI